MLSGRENFSRMMRHENPERLPIDLPVTPPIVDLIEQKTGTRDVVQAFDTDFRSVWATPKNDPGAWAKAFARMGFELPATARIDTYGVTHNVPPRESVKAGYHFLEMLHPLSVIQNVAQLEELPWPDMSDPQNYAHMVREIAATHDQGRVAVGGCECTLFEHAWYVRGMDLLFGDLVEENGIADWLLDWFTLRSVQVTSAYARAGADVIALGDDVGTQRGMMMSVDFWHQHLRPRLARVVGAIRAAQNHPVLIRYHSDGDISPIATDLVEMGIDILNPIQPECMNPADFIPAHQHHMAFWGMIGTQTTMPFGTPEDVRKAVAQCADLARRGAAMVVAPTHVLEPDVPWENIVALVEAVKQNRLE